MLIAITGGRGQLGRTLERVLGAQHQIIILDLPECDVTQSREIDRIAALKPDLIIHAAALTDVDGCARDPIAAYRANALGTHNVALACQRAHATMLYISTNEVFDGAQTLPYREFDPPRARNPYGASNLAGERAIQMLLDRFYIVRIAWLFAPGGNNFPKKIIELARQRGALTGVTDEIANPTYAPDLAHALARLIETRHYGILHLTNAGIASRYDFIAQILKHAGLAHIPLTPRTLADYPRASTPPTYSALANIIGADILGIQLRPWQDALEEYFKSL
ncbi:MAG: dTDP-4-dehydrorhamnose reductase [Chloroflexi bacterium]|nr:dTDP-4-dehydrorhamnose reductase [Chloroflexota bacterium]